MTLAIYFIVLPHACTSNMRAFELYFYDDEYIRVAGGLADEANIMITSDSDFVVHQMILVFSIEAFYELSKKKLKEKHDDEYLYKDYRFFLLS